jgi:outer membrane protein assembly factor BamA
MEHVYISRAQVGVCRWWWWICAVVLAVTVSAGEGLASTGMPEVEPVRIETIAIEGTIHTKPDTLIRLLPRPAPADYTRAEIEEFERRVRNLSLFDQVQVTRDGPVLTVVVQEKVTLAPILSFTRGSTLKDLTATGALWNTTCGGRPRNWVGSSITASAGRTLISGSPSIRSNPNDGRKNSRAPTM